MGRVMGGWGLVGWVRAKWEWMGLTCVVAMIEWGKKVATCTNDVSGITWIFGKRIRRIGNDANDVANVTTGTICLFAYGLRVYSVIRWSGDRGKGKVERKKLR